MLFNELVLQTLIVGARQNRLDEAVTMDTHNLDFSAKI